MKKATKFLAAAVLFAAALCFTVMGITSLPVHADEAQETATSAWQTFAGNDHTLYTEYGETDGLFHHSRNAVMVVNKTDILSVEGHTVKFNMMFDSANQNWSAMYFINGQNWRDYNWTTGQKDENDPYYHFIFQSIFSEHTSSGQMFASGKGDSMLCEADQIPTDLDRRLVPIEIHIGNGGDDPSYIKMDDKLVVQKGQQTSIYAGLTADMFPDGCYFVMHLNTTTVGNLYLSEYGEASVSDLDYNYDTIKMFETTPMSNDVSFKVSDLDATADAAVLYMNGHVIDKSYYTAADEDGKIAITLKKEYWNRADAKADLANTSILTVAGTEKKANVLFYVALEEAPVFETTEQVIGEEENATFNFTSARQGLKSSDFTIVSKIFAKSNSGATTLTPGQDYAVSGGSATAGGYAYKLSILSDYIASVTEVYRGRLFEVSMGSTTTNLSVYVRSEQKGWITRPVDIAEGTEPVVDDYYTTVQTAVFKEAVLSSRIYYNEGIDVSQPISIEMSPAYAHTEWAMLNVSDSLVEMDYFSDNSHATSKLQGLFFGGKNGHSSSDMQKFLGFEEEGGTNVYFTASTMKNLVVEIYFAKDDSETGYFKINGENLATPTALQSDFRDGKAYIGFFFDNNNVDVAEYPYVFNSHINAVSVISPSYDSAFKESLSSPTDFSVVLGKTAGNLTVKDETGKTLSASEYAYESTTSTLTIKAAYFAAHPYSKGGVISIWDNDSKTGTQFKLAYSSQGLQKAKIAFAGIDDGKDVEFDIGAAVESVTKNDVALDASAYTVSGTKLTVKRSAIRNDAGIDEFIVTAGGKYYPCYVYVREFAESGYKTGAGTLESVGKNTYGYNGEVSHMLKQVFDLSGTLTVNFNISAVKEYYENSANAGSPVSFRFEDPFTGYTLIYTVWANYPDDKINNTNPALYTRIEMIDADGLTVLPAINRALSISASDNKSAFGPHTLTISAGTNGSLAFKIDAAREQTVSAGELNNFNLGACVLTITTGEGCTCTVGVGSSSSSGNTSHTGGGCSGDLATSGLVFGVFALAAVAAKKRMSK